MKIVKKRDSKHVSSAWPWDSLKDFQRLSETFKRLSENFRDFQKLSETFKDFFETFKTLHEFDEVLWTRQVLHGKDEVFEQRSQQEQQEQFSNL